jgi:hypothetical protein
MESYNTFDANVQCDELNLVSEAEYDEVMAVMAEEAAALESYAEWSGQVEEGEPVKDWLGGYSNSRKGPRVGAFDV